jgi:hypothetical protein
MHRLDQSGVDIIIAEALPENGPGLAINDRLRRASLKKAFRNGRLFCFSTNLFYCLKSASVTASFTFISVISIVNSCSPTVCVIYAKH